MNATSRPGAVLKSSDETSRPSRSGSRNDGSIVPSGSIVEGVSAMRQAYPSGIRIAAVPRRVGLTIVGAALCLLAVGAGSALPQVPAGDFFEAIDHPAIGYH